MRSITHIVTTIVVESKMASDGADAKAAVEIKNGKIPMTGYKTRDGNWARGWVAEMLPTLMRFTRRSRKE